MPIDPRTLILGVAFCTLWSSAFTVGKFAVQSSPPILFLTIRFAIAFFLIWGILTILKRGLPKDPRDRWTGFWLGALNNALYLGLCFMAFKTTSASMVGMIASLMPLVTAAIAWPVLGERLTLRKCAGLALGTAGAWYILSGRLAEGPAVDDPFGFILAGIGTVCLAIGTVLYRKRGTHADALGMNALQAGAASILLLPAGLLLEDPSRVIFDFNLAWTLAYTSIVMTMGAFLLWFLLIRAAGAGNASAFHFLNPGITMLIAWIILSEPIGAREVLGLIPVAIGILLVNWPAKKKAAA